MGAIGRIHPNGDLDLALTIRTFAVAEGRIHLWVGGGIVWDSEPDAEIEESLVKARPLLAAIGAPLPRAASRGDEAKPAHSRQLSRLAVGREAKPRRRRRRAARGRAGRARRRPADEPVLLRRRRGAPPRAGRVRDAARLRRAAVPDRASTSRGCAARRRGSASPWPGGFEQLAVAGARGGRRARSRAAPLPHPRARRRGPAGVARARQLAPARPRGAAGARHLADLAARRPRRGAVAARRVSSRRATP